MNDEDVSPFIKIVLAFVGVSLLCIAVLLACGAARAHGAAQWIQDNPNYTDMDNPNIHCCGPSDCGPWPEEDVEVTPDGFHLKSTGETIPFKKTYLTEPDQVGHSAYWRCKRRTDPPQTRCLFVPGGAT